MHEGRIVFAQLMDFAPRRELNKCIARYCGNHRVRRLTCYSQWLAMAFAQLTARESLRDIENCLNAMRSKLYHAGFRARVKRSTLADANELRDWRIWQDWGQVLIGRARNLYADEDLGVELNKTVYALDSTTIDLCLSLFPWARFRRSKGAVKLHTLMDLRGAIPCQVWVSHGAVHDVNILDNLNVEPGALYIMDRAYIDFVRLFQLHLDKGWFITRAKTNLQFTRRASRTVNKSTGLRCDQTIRLLGVNTRHHYPELLRRITYIHPENKKRFVFLTNNFALPAFSIAELYRLRWQVELFFKWIKQHLRIKAFFGTSLNAVKTQIWIAICVYVLVAIVKKQLGIEKSLYEILQILSIALFEYMPVKQLLMQSDIYKFDNFESMQLNLFNF